jgi:hypothetical protein
MVSYAFTGAPPSFVACTTNRDTGEHEHHYPSPGAIGLEFARPIPTHALTDGARAAVARMAARRRMELDLTADVGNPPIVPHSGKPPADLARIERLAIAAGFTVTRYESVTGHALQGVRGDVGFRAYWQHGRTRGATWHERRARWVIVDDPRPIKMNVRDSVGLKGYRSEGMGRQRLKLVASPAGMPLNVTDLEKRLTT